MTCEYDIERIAWWRAVKNSSSAVSRALLHRSMAHEHVVAGIAAALAVGALTADAVAVEARKAAQADDDADAALAETSDDIGEARAAAPQVASLTQRRLTALPPDTRPQPSVAAYDQLLRNRPAARPTHQGDLP
ncbi:MAG: hypothetical protein GEV03_23415 [Streptosporangiales bacterium]|nr:hypothetical protein [Streptosporangiales bacterium]